MYDGIPSYISTTSLSPTGARIPARRKIIWENDLRAICFYDRLRCDRTEPCGTCVRRGLAESCVYVRSSGQGPVNPTQPIVNTMADRINQLEQLVTSLVESNKNTNTSDASRMSPASSVTPTSPGRPASVDASHSQDPRHWGQIRVEDNKSTYVPSTHWTVILDKVTLTRTPIVIIVLVSITA